MSDDSHMTRRWRWLLAGVLLCCIALPAMAQHRGDAPEPTVLTCGETATGTLAPGETARFVFDALPGEAVTIEAVDVSGNEELLQLRLEGPELRMNTCTGRLQPTLARPALAHLAGGTYLLEVSDCRDDAAVQFAITLNLVSGSRRACGRVAPCAEPVLSRLTHPGEVDSFRFAARPDEIITLDFSGEFDTRGGLEVRVFDPDGLPVGDADGCGLQRTFATAKLGTYTVLANACLGYGVGAYRFQWQTENACPPLLLRGLHSAGGSLELAVSANGDRIERLAGAGLTCGFAELGEFRHPVTAPIRDGAFARETIPLPTPEGGPAAKLAVDGIVFDSDGDGQPDQAMGGLGLATDGGRCIFHWVATNQADNDGDAWGDVAERRYGSNPDEAASVPETGGLPTTALFGPGFCLDAADNDADGATDLEDANCNAEPARPNDAPKTYAGRHSAGQAFWLERNAGDAVVASVDAVELGCPGLTVPSLHLPLAFAIAADGRFSRQGLQVPSSETTPINLAVDGIFFDIDGDGIDEQAIGGLELRYGGRRCVRQWSATAHLDSDNDGWSDAVERRLGSDPQPLPQGLGGSSVPEQRLLPRSLLVGLDVCTDGIDNDGDGKLDNEDFPACPAEVPTGTPVPTYTQTALPTMPPAQTFTATPLASTTPTPTQSLPTTPTFPVAATATPQAPTPCSGDCDGNSAITVDEILQLVATSLGAAPLDCAAGDVDASGSITVDEIVSAVNRALLGCD